MTDALAQRIAATGLVCVSALAVVGFVAVSIWGTKTDTGPLVALSGMVGTCLGALSNYLTPPGKSGGSNGSAHPVNRDIGGKSSA